MDGQTGRWKMMAHLGDFARNSIQGGFVVNVLQRLIHPSGDSLHLRFAHSARSHRGSSESDPAGAEWFSRIIGNRVVVADDSREIERVRGLSGDHVLVGQIHQYEVIVSTA